MVKEGDKNRRIWDIIVGILHFPEESLILEEGFGRMNPLMIHKFKFGRINNGLKKKNRTDFFILISS